MEEIETFDVENTQPTVEISSVKSKGSSKFICDICFKIFFSKAAVKRHLMSHNRDLPYPCDICPKKFDRPSTLKKHMQMHNSVTIFPCNLCEETFLSSVLLKKHKKTHAEYKLLSCHVCGKNLKRKNLNIHYLIHTGERPHQCDVCKKTFVQRTHLRRHKETHNVNKKKNVSLVERYKQRNKCRSRINMEGNQFQCDVCGLTFHKANILQNHRAVHSDEAPFQCSVCSKKFKHASAFYSHKRVHRDYKAYKCEVCSKTFKNPSVLYTHRRVHTGERPYQCNICLKRFTQGGHLNIHKKTHSGEKPFECEICGKRFITPASLREHREIHKENRCYECEICEKKFTTLRNFKKHRREHKELNAEEISNDYRPTVQGESYTNVLAINPTNKCESTNNTSTYSSSDYPTQTLESHGVEECKDVHKVDSKVDDVQKYTERAFESVKEEEVCDIDLAVSKQSDNLFETVSQDPLNIKAENNTGEIEKVQVLMKKGDSFYDSDSDDIPLKFACSFQDDSDREDAGIVDSLQSEKNTKREQIFKTEESVALKRFTCNVCDKKFILDASLKVHKKIHVNQTEMYKLDHGWEETTRNGCSENDLYLDNCKNDDEKHHGCIICGKRFVLVASLMLHGKIHGENFKANIVNDLKVEDKVDMDKDSEEKTPKVKLKRNSSPKFGIRKKVFECDVCQRKFDTLARLIPHKRLHTGEKPFQCDKCPMAYANKLILHRHVKIHSGVKPYACDVCGKTFVYKKYLNIHYLIHTGERPYQCDICMKTFIQGAHLKTHKDNVHNKSSVKKVTQRRPPRKLINLEGNQHQCDVCGLTFRQFVVLKNHKKTHSSDRPYECNVCLKKFKLSSALYSHKKTHKEHKDYKCEICSKEFTHKSLLNVHKRIHTGERPYQCNICERKFNQSSHLKMHERIHSGEKPHECDICYKKFVTPATLREHQQIHDGGKFYDCGICGKRLSNLRNLKKHVKVHDLINIDDNGHNSQH